MALSLLVIGDSSFAAKGAGWPSEWYNPKPQPDDLVLPMPCGGAMAFRRVDTLTSDQWLSDQKISLGRANDATAHAEDSRFAYLAGSFSAEGAPRQRHYFIGKYELTLAQFQAVMDKTCPDPGQMGEEGGLPKEGVGWFDAVNFSQKYSQWLLRNARDSLPHEDGVPGFVRLPTESEWEYAARGGEMLRSRMADQTHPMKGDISEYAWGSSQCDGQTQYVGGLNANPLGLHDVLGNVGEIALEPYRATAPGRMHGQVGGYVVRGGSCRTSEFQLRSADRLELPLFDVETGEVTRQPFTGFRLTVGAPVGTSVKRLDDLRQSHAALGGIRATDLIDGDPVASARALAAAAGDPGLAKTLNQLASQITTELARRTEIEESAARMTVLSAGVMMRSYRYDFSGVRTLEAAIQIKKSEEREHLEKRRDGLLARASLTGQAYLSMLLQATEDLGPDLLRSQLPRVERALSYEDADMVVKLTRLFVAHSTRHATRPPANLDEFLTEILSVQ
ncbi:MAG: SUMF1/EgtB/PvdO family nonheme iron enzyme [Alphaproteobacteria bacterium]|nr:SUMF1/EgtB/PvdO family nonheme iron enzyme [Alphaproteobacteria bacterium]